MSRLLGLLLLLPGFAAFVASAQLPEGAIQAPVEQLQWRPGPASLPEGTRMMVLEGDPQKAGLFTMRLQVPAGTKLAPHWHPRDERVTVLEGAVAVGFGEVFDESRLAVFRAGSFYLNPARFMHFVAFPQDAVIQITGEGPWALHYR